MNNITRAINRNADPDWNYVWKYVNDAEKVRFVPVRCPGKRWENKWGIVEPDPERPKTHSRLTMKVGYAWDGCSIAPDAPGTKDGSGFHDLIYQFIELLACAWNVPVSVARRFGDRCFNELMRQDKCPVRGLYFGAVRVVGGAFHWLAKQFD